MPIIHGKHRGRIKPSKKQVDVMRRAVMATFVPKGTAGPWMGLKQKVTRVA